jgi:hypothetical protein
MENSPLGKLPAELRNTISDMVLRHDRIEVKLSPFDYGIVFSQTGLIDGAQDNKHPLALALTCRETRNDCTKLYHARNKFLIDITGTSYHRFRDWFKTFAEVAGPTLGKCVAWNNLNVLDDDQVVASLLDTAQNLPNHFYDGLAPLSHVDFTGKFLGNECTLSFAGNDVQYSIHRACAKLMRYIVCTAGFRAGPTGHGSRCWVRAIRTALCLIHCLQELIGTEMSRNLHQPTPSPAENIHVFQQGLAATCRCLENEMSRKLQDADTPCRRSGCQPENSG